MVYLNKPGMFSFTEGYKWDAWNNNKGKNKEIAEEEYIILVNSLLKKYKLKKNK
jgi:diazepam-binding inhibitor (GABA receptor modulator, acyl-CoA-binding protein)